MSEGADGMDRQMRGAWKLKLAGDAYGRLLLLDEFIQRGEEAYVLTLFLKKS